MNARSKLLRQNAATLRRTAATAEGCARTVRALSVRLPAALLQSVERDMRSGALERFWAKCLADAEELGEDQVAGALGALLTRYAAMIGQYTADMAKNLDARTQNLRGQAEGIESALESLDEKKAAPPDGG